MRPIHLGRVLIALCLSLLWLAPSVAHAATGNGQTAHKSYVCKYVGTPFVNETLQTGQNPIWVDNSSLVGDVETFVGQEFSDQHGRSVVVVANTDKLDPEPSVGTCPPPDTTRTATENRVSCANGHESRELVYQVHYVWDGTEFVADETVTNPGEAWIEGAALTPEELEANHCSKVPTTRAVTQERTTCEGHQVLDGVETTTYAWNGESWVGSASTVWGTEWRTVSGLTNEEQAQYCPANDVCPQLDGDQPIGTQCTHAPDVVQTPQQRMSCDDGVEGRTVTTTTSYSWGGSDWVAGTPSADDPEWTFVRDLSDAEAGELQCNIVEPPTDACLGLPGMQPPGFDCTKGPRVTIRSQVRKSCAAGVQRREITRTTAYHFADGAWVAGETTAVRGDWTRVRGLTAHEKAALGCLAVSPPEAPVAGPKPSTGVLPATGAPPGLQLAGLVGAALVLAGAGLVGLRRPRRRIG